MEDVGDEALNIVHPLMQNRVAEKAVIGTSVEVHLDRSALSEHGLVE